MRSITYILLLVLVLLTSCGQYEKLLKSTDYELKKTKAKEYYEAGKYVKSTELLEQIIPRYRATEEAEDLIWMNAQSYFGMKQYEMAGSVFESYVEQYGYGKYIEDATYMTALCEYNVSPKAELDQEYTRKAIDGFDLFLSRYPNSPRVEECLKNRNELHERLVEKSYMSARLYYDMNNYKAAVVALSNTLKNYAETKYREEMMFLKLSSLYEYASRSLAEKQKERYQATLDDYYSFMEEFPQSKYSKDVKKIYEETSRYLKIVPSVNGSNTQ
jgi:outer membrane protein assembly factor BamD